MSKVFLIEEPKMGIDVSMATAYGELFYLFDSDIRRGSAFKTETFGQQILDRLRQLEFNYENDFVVMTGSLVPVVVMSIAIVSTHPYVRLLFYNAAQAEYVSKKVSQTDWKGTDESKSS